MMKIDHIGYLVNDMDNACKEFEELGFVKEGECIRDDRRGINICFMKNGGYRIELISSQNFAGESDVKNLIKKYKNAPYHLCYEVDDIEKITKELVAQRNYLVIKPAETAIAFKGKRVAFLLHGKIGMIELVEK